MNFYLKTALPVICLALACLFAGPAQAGQVDMTDVIFKEVEKRLIREYYSGKNDNRYGRHDDGKSHAKKRGKGKHGKKSKNVKGGLPPGLAKRKHLPPGLAKRKRLPPGLAKRSLPNDLNDILPMPARGTERVIIDNNVVLIQKATSIVLDILLDAVEGAK